MRLLTVLVFFSSLFADNDNKELYPRIVNTPDITDKGISSYNFLVKRYLRIDSLIRQDDKDAVNDEDLNFWQENEFIEENRNPFKTLEIGCSWYCAGGPYTISSSSNLPSSNVSSYISDNAHDFDLKTAWAVKGGKGESLSFYFKGSTRLGINAIHFYNGYIKSESAWRKNSRVKRAVLLVDGEALYYLNLEDSYKQQRFSFNTIMSKSSSEDLVLTFKILEVYKGEKYDDVCISEINFDGVGDH